MIYLDNSATTKPTQEVINTITDALKNNWGNPSSTYDIGIEARKALEEAREYIATYIGANSNEIIFTSGACESNSLAFNIHDSSKYRFIISAIEHKSIDSNPKVNTRIQVSKSGFVNIEELIDECTKSAEMGMIPFVSIQWANGEIGTIQAMGTITAIVHEYGGIVHTDATQMIADKLINVDLAEVDLLSFSGQKIGAPKGVGVLYVRSGIEIDPLIYGSQENELRGGTENLPYILGLSTALHNIKFTNIAISEYFRNKLLSLGRIHINSDTSYSTRLANNLSVTFYGYDANEILTLLAEKGIYASAGAACENGSNTPSRVLKAIGLSDKDARSTIRFTLNGNTTFEEIDTAVKALKEVLDILNLYK